MTTAPRRDCFLAAMQKGLVTEGLDGLLPVSSPSAPRDVAGGWQEVESRPLKCGAEAQRRLYLSTLITGLLLFLSSLLLQNVKCGEIR